MQVKGNTFLISGKTHLKTSKRDKYGKLSFLSEQTSLTVSSDTNKINFSHMLAESLEIFIRVKSFALLQILSTSE